MTPDAALTAFGFNRSNRSSIASCGGNRQRPDTGWCSGSGGCPRTCTQALKALLQKGAISEESDAADATSYVPVPPGQLFASLRNTFLSRAETALDVLQQVHNPPKADTLA